MDLETGQIVLTWFFKVCFVLVALSVIGKNLTRFDSRFSRMTLGVGVSVVVVFSTALAYLEIPGRYYFPIILVSSLCLHIIQSKSAFSFRPKASLDSVLRQVLHSKVTKQKFFDVIMIFSTSIIFYLPAISRWKGEISTIGNPDPINYALINRHVMSFGFGDSPHLVNRDLGSWAKWDWTGVHGFFAFFNSALQQYSGSTTLLFILTIVIIMQMEVIGLIRTFIPITTSWLQYLVPLVVIWGFSSQLFWYSVGSGFIAQLLFMAITPLLIMSSYQVLNNTSVDSKEKNSFYTSIISSVILGVSLTIYFPYASMVFFISVIFFAFGSIHQVFLNGFRSYFEAILIKKRDYVIGFLVFVIAAWPVLGYVKTGLIVLTTSRPAGWSLPEFSLNQFLPIAQLCLPGSDLSVCKYTPSSLIIATFFLVTLISIFGLQRRGSRESQRIKYYLSFWILFFVGIGIAIISKYGIAEYRSWKFLMFIQLLLFSIFIPFYFVMGMTQLMKRQQDKASIRNSILVSSILVVVLIPQQRINLWDYSVYSFGAEPNTAKLLNEQSLQQGKGLNIDIEGLGAMLVALYVPNQPIAFVKDAAYYPPVESNFRTAITLSSNLTLDTKGKEIPLNSKYVLTSR